MKCTSVRSLTILALSAVVFSAIPASAAARPSFAPFDATFVAYQELSANPASTRDQWLRVIRSFVEIHKTTRLGQISIRSHFFAGRACLSLYRRSGNRADLDEAIRHLNGFVRKNRSGPYLILGLQELKEAHLLKRRLSAVRDERVVLPSAEDKGHRPPGQNATGQPRALPENHAVRRGPEPTPRTDTVPQESHSSPAGPGAAEQFAHEPAVPRQYALPDQPAAHVHQPGVQAPVREVSRGAPASSGHNCTGNPFFGTRGNVVRKSAQPILSASLPPPTMNDAPRPLRSEPPERARDIEAIPKPVIANPPAAVPGPSEKSPGEQPAKDSNQTGAPVQPSAARPEEPAGVRQNEIVSEQRDEAGGQKYVVVIDPGHGGKDPGATSNDGQLKEKEIVLHIANRIKARIEKTTPSVAVALTRTDDTFLPVQERTAFANSLNADLFVSIHCNGAEDASSRGIETYYLSKASSKKAMASAARENGIPADRMSDIDATLLDLLLDSKKNESVKLAETVHNALITAMAETNSPGRNRGVKRAPFYVLLGAKMPAILVECGFVNGKERESLKDPCFLDSLAEGITGGIRHYLQGLGDKG